MPTYRILKQLKPAPQASLGDPPWASRNVWVARTGSEQIWEFSGNSAEASASIKMNELTGSDSSGRLYQIIQTEE